MTSHFTESTHQTGILNEIQRLPVDDQRIAAQPVLTVVIAVAVSAADAVVAPVRIEYPFQLLQRVVQVSHFFDVGEMMELHAPLEVAAAVGDVDGGGFLVPGENPNAHPGAIQADLKGDREEES